MAHVYTGDTLCRMHKPDEAWPYYAKGFDLGPNELSLIALALQCLWDEKHLAKHEDELRQLALDHPGSWIAYLAIDTLENGEKNKGVDPKYRPRGYNEGPRDKEEEDEAEDEALEDDTAGDGGALDVGDADAGAADAGAGDGGLSEEDAARATDVAPKD
jgi:hypothetical protein